VELHAGAPDGPVVGRAFPGAVLDVTPDGRGHARIKVPRAHDALFAEADAFGSIPKPDVAPAPTGRLLKDMPGIELTAVPYTGKWFAETACGEIRVSASDPRLVSQFVRGVELTGYADWPLEMARGPIRCALRTVTRETDGRWTLARGTTAGDADEVRAVPDGFVHDDPAAADDLAPLFANGGSVYWLHASEARVACKKWTFGKVHDELGGVLALEPPIKVDGQRAFASFLTGYDGPKRELLLLGPHFSSRPRDRASMRADLGGYRCGTTYTFVGAREGALRMFPGGPGPRTIAWHPDDEELWYRSEEACARAETTAREALARAPDATPPGGVHLDCYPELQP
jgi:hypothetical protein